jgi:PadR family transcriptional regulator, regulatory protein PadR
MVDKPSPRMTQPTQAVVRALLAEPSREFYGLELGTIAGLPSGTIHPILARLEACEWVESRWETIDPHQQGRPRRRYYSLTANGAIHARSALARVDAKIARLQGRARPSLSGGFSWSV